MSKATAIIDYQYYWDEVRGKVIAIGISFVAGALIGAIKYRTILSAVIACFNLKNVNIVLTSPNQFFNLIVSVSFLSGILVATPLLIFNLVSFIRPALTEYEFKLIVKLIPISVVLFIFGFVFGTWILQFMIDIYVDTTKAFNVNNLWDIENFLSQIIIMGLSMALVFQLPILLTGLMRLKVIRYRDIASKRRYVYAILIIFDVLLPPTDVVSMALIFIPLCLLFEGTLLFNRRI